MAYRAKALLALSARTANGDSTSLHTGVGNNVSLCLRATAKTGTTPTLTCTVQWSFDKTTWIDGPTADNFTVLNNATVPTQEFKDLVVRAPYLRVHYVFGGTATPGYTFEIQGFVRN